MQYELPFMTGLAHQKYLAAEEGILEAHANGCSHWYVDGSLHGEMADSWSQDRIDNLKSLIKEYKCQPLFHGNFKVPLASDMSFLCDAAVEYTKLEIDICAQLNAPLIIHAGAVVEPKMILKAKQKGLENYANSVKQLHAYARERNVDLYLENLSNYKNYRPFHYLFTNYDEYQYIFSETQDLDGVYFFFDVGHSNIGNEDTLKVFQDFSHKIKGVSLSNNNAVLDQHFPISKGDINYEDFVMKVMETSWRGLVAFETRGITTENSVQELAAIYHKCLLKNTDKLANHATEGLAPWSNTRAA